MPLSIIEVFNLLKSLQQNSNGPDQVKEGTDIENENNYWRSVYILQGFTEAQENEGIEYLYQVIFSHDHGKWPINHQLRALKCLLSVIGTQNLGEILEKSTEDLEARFQNLCLVSKLESLNLPYHSNSAFGAPRNPPKSTEIRLVEIIKQHGWAPCKAPKSAAK